MDPLFTFSVMFCYLMLEGCIIIGLQSPAKPSFVHASFYTDIAHSVCDNRSFDLIGSPAGMFLAFVFTPWLNKLANSTFQKKKSIN